MHVLFAFPLIWLECPLICTLCPTYPNLTAISTLLFNATLISAAQVTGIKDRSQQPMCYDCTCGNKGITNSTLKFKKLL